MPRRQAHYLMIERKYGSQPASWHPLWEGKSATAAQKALETMPAIYGEISRRVIKADASTDSYERRPC
jgi:hypothetical protein